MPPATTGFRIRPTSGPIADQRIRDWPKLHLVRSTKCLSLPVIIHALLQAKYTTHKNNVAELFPPRLFVAPCSEIVADLLVSKTFMQFSWPLTNFPFLSKPDETSLQESKSCSAEEQPVNNTTQKMQTEIFI